MRGQCRRRGGRPGRKGEGDGSGEGKGVSGEGKGVSGKGWGGVGEHGGEMQARVVRPEAHARVRGLGVASHTATDMESPAATRDMRVLKVKKSGSS